MTLNKREIVNNIKKFELFDKEGYPFLLAIKDNKQAKIWCKYCKRWHYHSPEAGHRVAHCGDGPKTYGDKGYFIVPMTLQDLDNLFYNWPMYSFDGE